MLGIASLFEKPLLSHGALAASVGALRIKRLFYHRENLNLVLDESVGLAHLSL